MKRGVVLFIAVGILTVSAGAAHATVLSFDPVKQRTGVGHRIDVGVRISGLGSNAPPSLGAFDLDVAFDDRVLDFVGLTFGDPVLGNQLDLFGFGANPSGFAEDPNPTVGLVNFFEISLDAPSDLDTMQADSFILATLTFDAIAPQVSALTFDAVTLSDSLGNTLTATTSSGVIAVPEPGTLALFTIALVGLGFVRPWRSVAA